MQFIKTTILSFAIFSACISTASSQNTVTPNPYIIVQNGMYNDICKLAAKQAISMYNKEVISKVTKDLESTYILKSSDLCMKTIGYADDKRWILDENGTIGVFIEITSESDINICTDAFSLNDITALMRIDIADQHSEFKISSKNKKDFRSSFKLPAGIYFLRISMVNSPSVKSIRPKLSIGEVKVSGKSVKVLNKMTLENALAASNTFIEHFRRAKSSVKLTFSNGNPIPEGTPVRIKLVQHDFMFGTSVPGGGEWGGDGWCADTVQPNSEDMKMRDFILSHFNTIVPDYGGKWFLNEPHRGDVKMDYVNNVLKFAEIHGLKVRMHNVFWDFNDYEADWERDLKNLALTDLKKREEYRKAISDRIKYYAADTAGKYAEIDGINESFHHPAFQQIYGMDGFANIYNDIGRVIGDKALLYVNEFQVLSDIESPSRPDDFANWYRRHIEEIEAAGGRVDAIGIQYHTSADTYEPIRDFQTLAQLSVMNKPLNLTEFSTDESPCSPHILETMMRLTFGCPKAIGFIMWGFHEKYIFRKGSHLVDNNFELTDAGLTYQQIMSKWNTNLSTKVGDEGNISFTGFYGKYDISIDGYSGNYHFTKTNNKQTICILKESK